MKALREDELRIAAEAARWQRILETGGAKERAEFSAWVKASPRHLEEFMFMEALDTAATQLDPEKDIDLEAILAELPANVVPLQSADEAALLTAPPTSSGSILPQKTTWKTWTVAAAVAVAVSTAALNWQTLLDGGWQRYSTAIGEQRAIELEDGSLIQLNTQSTLHVRFSKQQRDINLLEGEALFKVAADPQRPFRVHADDTVIRAVGTQFNVYRKTADMEISIIEGRVEISKVIGNREPAEADRVTGSNTTRNDLQRPMQLGAGTEAVVTRSRVTVREARDIAEFAAWRQRRLVFEEDSLGNIAAEFNRYNRTPQIVVTDDTARNERYGGTFDADDPESLAQYVTDKGYLSVTREPGKILIGSKH